MEISNTNAPVAQLEQSNQPSNIIEQDQNKSQPSNQNDKNKKETLDKADDLFESKVDFSKPLETHKDSGWLFRNLLQRSELTMVKAPPGSGSTWTVLDIATSAALERSLFSHFEYKKSTNGKQDEVFIFEAGNYTETLRSRIELLSDAGGGNNFHLFSRDDQLRNTNKRTIDLTKEKHRKFLSDYAAKSPMNILYLFYSLDTLIGSDASKDAGIHKWIENMKLDGVSQIWFDKSGGKGCSFPHHLVDLELEIKPLSDREKVAMEISFSRSKTLPKELTHPFVIELNENNNKPGLAFEYKSVEIDKKNLAIALLIEGVKQMDVARRLKVSQSSVSTWRSEAESDKLVLKRGHNTIPTEEGEKLVKKLKLYSNL